MKKNKSTAPVIKNDLKYTEMSEGTCIAKPNLEVLLLA